MPQQKKRMLAQRYAEELVEYQELHTTLMQALNDERVSPEAFEQLKEDLCAELSVLKETKVELQKQRHALGGGHERRGEA